MHLDASDFAAMDDSQRLAVLETMIVGLIADNKVTPAEIRRFDEIVLGLPWGVDREVLVGMITGARERVTSLKGGAQIQDYLIGVANRIPSPAMRDKVIFTMATLMLSDGEMDKLEQNVLGLFVVSFGLTSDRVAAIKAALFGAQPPQPAQPPPATN